MSRTRMLAGLAMCAALALPAAPAAAQTAIFSDDAEGAVDARWVVGQPPDGVEAWQKSDSSAQKYRGNQAHGGATSFWSGMQPQNWPLVPTTAGPGTFVEGESTLTIKEPIIVPADGTTTLRYWSLFQNEGDDSGSSQVAPIGADGKPGAWKNLKTEAAVNTSAGDTDPRACDPTRPDHTLNVPFEEQKAPLATWAGHAVLIRFVLKYGAENRPVSHPCGWYLDDIVVETTGTPGKLAGAAPATGGAPTPAVPAAKPSVRFRSLRPRGKRAVLSFTVTGGELKDVVVTLLKGRRKMATAKTRTLAAGSRKLTFRSKRRLAKGSYRLRLVGKTASGEAFRAAGSVRGR